MGKFGTYYKRPAKGSKRLSYPDYKALVQEQAKAALGGREVDGEGLYMVEVEAYLTSLRGDWDNIGGTFSDALEGVIWEDDSHVVRGVVRKWVEKKRKRCWVEVTVWKMKG